MKLLPQDILKEYWGYDSFRPPQDLIVNSVLEGKDTFALLPTGGGKSITFQIPILLQDGICLVVSPLIALMKDQVKNLRQKGIKAELISSELTYQDIEIILDNCRFGGVKLLYVSPERMQSQQFQAVIKTLNVAYVAIDEAHCISEWGHDFRPSYLALKQIKELLTGKPILALTATATPYIEQEIIKELDLYEPNIYKKSLYRSNLAYRIFPSEDKYRDLVYLLQQNPGASIVFCKTRRDTYELATYLQKEGFDADFYHARLSAEIKNQKQKEFISSNAKILVSTNAFGMGIDKPNIRNVFHLNAPSGIESYIQEVGRAGRDGMLAQGVLLLGKEDKKNAFKAFRSSLPNKIDFLTIINKLYNYFQIGNHELLSGQKPFSERKFIQKFKLSKQKTKKVLQFLVQQQVIDIQRSQHQSLIKILIKNVEIQDANTPTEKVLSYLARNYGGIFLDPLPIDEYIISRRLQMSRQQVKDILKKLHDSDRIFYRDASIVKISFLEARDDNHIRVHHYKHFEKLQRIKWQRLQAMYYFIENETICKSQLILRYFGEKKTPKCGICNICQPETSQSSLHTAEIINYLRDGAKTTKQLYQKFHLVDKAVLLSKLQELLDEEKITFKLPDIYSL